MVKKHLLICLLVTCQQITLIKSDDSKAVNTTPKVSSIPPKQSNNGSDGSISVLPLAQTLTSGDISSDLSDLWAKAELLPLNDEDFPVALYASPISSSSSSLSSSSGSVKESNDNSVSEKSTLKPSSVDISSSEVLKRVGWSSDQSRYSGENKGWSKQINVGQSNGSPGSDKSDSAQPSHIQSINHQTEEIKASPSMANSGTNMEMVDLTAAATSNNYEVPSSSGSSSSSNDGSSSSSGPGRDNSGNGGRYSSYNSDSPRPRTRYGFRVTNSRHREPEFSSSSHYDDFAPPDYPTGSSGSGGDSMYGGDSFESGPPPPPPSGSSGSGEDYRGRITEGERNGPNHDIKHSDGPPLPPPPPPAHTHDNYEREPQRPKYSGYRPRYRTKQHFMSSSASWPEFSEWDSPSSSDRGWLSSLFGNGGSGSSGYKVVRPNRYRSSPFGLTTSAETIPLSSLPSSFFDDAIPYYKPQTHHHPHPHAAPSAQIHTPMPAPRPSSWFNWAGAGLRPHASTLRPSYSFGSYGYGGGYGPRPLMSTAPPPPSPYSYSYGGLPSSSSMIPVSVRSPYTFGSMMSSPSMSYPLKMAYTSPYTSGFAFRSPYPFYRPFLPSSDLAFAESFRKPNTSEKMEGSASQSAMAFASPPGQGSPQQHHPPQQIPMLTGPNGALLNPLASFVNRPGSNGIVDPIFNFFNPGSINSATEKPANSESSGAASSSSSSSSGSSSSSSAEGTTASPAAKKNTGLFSGLRKIF